MTETSSSTSYRAITSCVAATLDGLMEAVPLSQARAAGGRDAGQMASECAALAIYALALAASAAPAAEASLQELLEVAGDRVGLLGVDMQPLAEQLARHLAVVRERV